MGAGGHSNDGQAGRDVADDSGPCSDPHIVPDSNSFSHHCTTADEYPVSDGHVAADRGVGHHTDMVSEGGVVTDGG